MIDGSVLNGNMALWFVEPAITYRINKGDVAAVLASVTNSAGIEGLNVASIVDTFVQVIPSADIANITLALNADSITHDATATADTSTITSDGESYATISTALSNAYHVLAYLDGELLDIFADETGDLMFGSLDAGTWRLIFIDRINYETSEISITAQEG